MEAWRVTPQDLKKYPHFDAFISPEKATVYVTNPERVSKHPFYPFMHYKQRWTRFAPKGQPGAVKERPIRYAARLDAYIFSYYRHILSGLYEEQLRRAKLGNSVLSYRHISVPGGKGGKSNVHFAADAVRRIQELGECWAIALDISSFFESLDHSILKRLWCRLLGVERLPDDHFQVFKAITQYSVVDKVEVYERLGHFGEKVSARTGNRVKGYLTPHRKIPTHLCDGKEFRAKIAGGSPGGSIIRKNAELYGIPQGAPMSDLLANLYLLDFDETIAGWVRSFGGAYFRYSDDILVLVPGEESDGRLLAQRIRELIRKFGNQLQIKKEKSSLFCYRRDGRHQTCELVEGTQGKNGLEYLGFRYDGKRVYVRNATISNLRRKVAQAAFRAADSCSRRYPGKDALALKSTFNYEEFIKRFGRVEDFAESRKDYKKWTFWTYATRAVKEFGTIGKPILHQLRKHEQLIRWRVDKELEEAVMRRERRKVRRPMSSNRGVVESPATPGGLKSVSVASGERAAAGGASATAKS
jgi:hypothetical protein